MNRFRKIVRPRQLLARSSRYTVTRVTASQPLVLVSMCTGRKESAGGYGVIRKFYEKPEVNAFLLKQSFAVTVPKGTFLVKRGVLPEHVIILEAGKVEISAPHCCAVILDGEDGERVFGLYAALSGEKPELDVICTDDCDVLLMRKDIFGTAIQPNPWVDLALARMLGNESTTADQILIGARRHPS
jgi:hypothetical protein